MKNQTLKTMLLILIVIGSKTNISAQQWPTIGKGFGNAPYFSPAASGTYYSPSVAFSTRSNVFYTAFIVANTYELVVMKSSAITGILGKVSWTKVGKISINANYTAPYIAINPITDEPNVVCIDNKKNEYIVQRFNQSQNMWQQVGVITEKAVDNFLPILSFKPNTEELYIAFISGANNAEVVVKKYDKNGWNSVGKNTIGNSIANIPQTPGGGGYNIIYHRSCSFAFQPNTNELCIAYVNTNNYLQVKKLSAADENWYDYGILSSLGKAEAISWNALAFNPLNNMPYLAYSVAYSPYGGYKVQVAKGKVGKQFPGASIPTFIWQDVLSDSLKLNNATSSIAFAPNTDNLYITGHDASFGVFLVKKFTGTTWSNLGYTYCSGIPYPLLSIGPSCGYNNARQTPTLVFNTITGKATLAYSNELSGMYELRYEP